MNAPSHKSATKGLREWWASPRRSGVLRLIARWEYRHLRALGLVRVASGIILASLGAFIFSYDAYGWATLFLALGAANLAGGCWLISLASSASAK